MKGITGTIPNLGQPLTRQGPDPLAFRREKLVKATGGVEAGYSSHNSYEVDDLLVKPREQTPAAVPPVQ